LLSFPQNHPAKAVRNDSAVPGVLLPSRQSSESYSILSGGTKARRPVILWAYLGETGAA